MSVRLVLCVCAALSLVGTAVADVPQLINYQGALISGGSPVTAPVNVVFALWNAATDGDSLWSEQQTITPDANGAFIALLGSVAPIPDSVFTGATYLSTKVEDDPEMDPRLQLVSVGYAYRVGSLAGAAGGRITGSLIIDNPAGDSVIIDPDLIVIRGSGGDDDEVSCSANGITVTDQNGDVRIDIAIDEDGPGITLYESASSRQKGGQATGGRKVEFREGGVLLFGSSEADTVCHLLPNGSIFGKGQLAMGSNNATSGDWANVLGFDNEASGDSSVVSGGYENVASGYASVISGGTHNTALGAYSVIGGGLLNHADSGYYNGHGGQSTIGGGAYNVAGYDGTVAGGMLNWAKGDASCIGGGYSNQAMGPWDVVPGGYYNYASGWCSFAAGEYARAEHYNTFVWNDDMNGYGQEFTSTNSRQFLIHAANGVGINTASPAYELDVAGDIQCVALHETSDARLKTDVVTLTDALAKIQQVRGVTFAWNAAAESFGADVGKQQIGIVAQELETVFPELVSTAADGYKAVDYSKLTPVLIEAIKDLKAENDEIKSQLAKMQALLRQVIEDRQ